MWDGEPLRGSPSTIASRRALGGVLWPFRRRLVLTVEPSRKDAQGLAQTHTFDAVIHPALVGCSENAYADLAEQPGEDASMSSDEKSYQDAVTSRTFELMGREGIEWSDAYPRAVAEIKAQGAPPPPSAEATAGMPTDGGDVTERTRQLMTERGIDWTEAYNIARAERGYKPKAKRKGLVIGLVVGGIALLGVIGAIADDSSDTAATGTTATSTTASRDSSPVTGAAPGVTSADNACVAYRTILGVIADAAAEKFGVVTETFTLLGDEGTLMALLLDPDTLDAVIAFFDESSDDFADYQDALPTAPASWAETDRQTRRALTKYESAYATIASAFRVFKTGDMERAAGMLSPAGDEITSATEDIGRATDAIPSGGC